MIRFRSHSPGKRGQGLLRLSPTFVVLACPQLVKAALALALFGGRQKHTDKNSVPVRGDPHILMVGDPGLGKSQMLQVSQRCQLRS